MIRPATAADLPQLIALGERFIRDTGYSARLRANPVQMAKTVGWLLDGEDRVILVAEHAGTLVGMIGLGSFPDPFSGDLVASELFWYSESPGAGVRLLKRAEAWARCIGAVRLQMVAPTDGVASMYERLGYELTERAYMRSVS